MAVILTTTELMQKDTLNNAFDSHPYFEVDPAIAFSNHGQDVIVHLGLLRAGPPIGLDLSNNDLLNQWLDANGRTVALTPGFSVGLRCHGQLAEDIWVLISMPRDNLSFSA
jgi:hypothetical protein